MPVSNLASRAEVILEKPVYCWVTRDNHFKTVLLTVRKAALSSDSSHMYYAHLLPGLPFGVIV